MANVNSLMVEFHRVGDPAQSLAKDTPYVRTSGLDGQSIERRMPIRQEDFEDLLGELRYPANGDRDAADQARHALAGHAKYLLDELPKWEAPLVQLDLVANVSELWAFPFEAVLALEEWQSVVLTRRVRAGFASKSQDWPAEPKVLFLHAPPSTDLSLDLIRRHEQALWRALAPWTKGGQPHSARYVCQPVFSAQDVQRYVEQEKPTHLHVLAHGKPAKSRARSGAPWGLRLGAPDDPATLPAAFAAAVCGSRTSPVVVTLAACDAGNVDNPALGYMSLAHELHQRGIPVVVASQLPLTQHGSVVMTKAFYTPLLCGADLRRALHSAREELKQQPEAGHDWLSLVSYVRLPEGYDEYVQEVGLRAEYGMLDAAQAEADRLNAMDQQHETDPATHQPASQQERDQVEARVRQRLESLQERLKDSRDLRGDRAIAFRGECKGLIGSANKRLAELSFRTRREESKQALEVARDAYREAYTQHVLHHWTGVQYLALDAVLTGRLKFDAWSRVHAAAELTSLTGSQDAFWAFGTLAELYLLSPLGDGSRRLDDAAAALRSLKDKAPTGAIVSTRRQLQRYVRWWTQANGFFPGARDFVADASELLRVLDEESEQAA